MLEFLDGTPLAGQIIYRRAERSLDVEPRQGRGVASLLVNDIQIEIDENGYLLYVWGFCPYQSWVPTKLSVPISCSGRLRYTNGAVVPGVSKRLNTGKPWPIAYDASSGWLCIGEMSARDKVVAFAPDAIAVLRVDHLAALWLHPNIQG